MKKNFCLIIVVLLFCFFPLSVGASSVNVSSVAPVDVDAAISGRAAAYNFDMPLAWRRHVSAQRELFLNPASIVERLIFYFNPTSVTASEAMIFEIAVVIRDEWRESLGYVKLTESDDYVFALRAASSNPYVFGSDRLVFDNILRDASDPVFLMSYISVPVRGDTVVRSTVSVNGKRMNYPSVTSNFRVVSVPLREVAEALGYTVGWDAASASITISSGTFFTTLGREVNIAGRHNVTNVDGISYISTMFFLQTLQCNVEIDEFSNVRIIREGRR